MHRCTCIRASWMIAEGKWQLRNTCTPVHSDCVYVHIYLYRVSRNTKLYIMSCIPMYTYNFLLLLIIIVIFETSGKKCNKSKIRSDHFLSRFLLFSLRWGRRGGGGNQRFFHTFIYFYSSYCVKI